MKTKFFSLFVLITSLIYSQKYKEINQNDFYVIGRDYFAVEDSTKLVGNFKFINYKPTPSGGMELDGYVLCTFDNFNRLNGIYKEYDLRGKIRFEAEYQKGEKNGIYKTYDLEGKLLLDLVYHEDGTTSGSYRIIRDNGMEKFSRKRGKLNGELYEVDRDGNLLRKANYINDTLNGKYVQNYLDGKPKIITEYYKGEKLGKYLEYDSKGNIKEESNHLLREKISNDSSVPIYKRSFTYPVGELKRYRNGKLELKEIYDDEGALTRRESYYQNGNKAMSSDYVWGETYTYDKEGNRSKFKWKSFRPDGIYKEFYENGEIKKIESWKNGNKNGEFVFYDSTGKIVKSYNMKDGLQDGEFYEILNSTGTEVKRIFDKGTLIHEIAYNNSKKIKEFSQEENGDYEDKRFWESTGRVRSLRAFDASENLLVSKGFDETGKQISGGKTKDGKNVGRIWSIDSSGNLISEEFYDEQGLPYGKHLLLGRFPHYKIYNDNNKLVREVFYDSYNTTKLTKELIYYETGGIKTQILYYEGRKEKVINLNKYNTRHGDYIIYSQDKDKWAITIPFNNGIIDGIIKVLGRDEWDTYTREFPIDGDKKYNSFDLDFNDTAPELILRDKNRENIEKLFPFGRI